jgi:hypothetical protein
MKGYWYWLFFVLGLTSSFLGGATENTVIKLIVFLVTMILYAVLLLLAPQIKEK